MKTAAADWDPDLYNRFRRYRAEPFESMLARLQLNPDERIVDLGCGSGENTVELMRRGARGSALGIDSSPAMIAKANELAASLGSELSPRLRFMAGDLRDFKANREYTLTFSNAAIQWISDHRGVLAACYEALSPDGRLVFGVPSNEIETAQMSMQKLAHSERWRDRLGAVSLPSLTVFSPDEYRRILNELGFADIDCYYLIFKHPMKNPAEVIEWSRATSLRPFLGALSPEEQGSFLSDLLAMLEAGYGTRGPMTFTFRRLFMWARRPAGQQAPRRT
ncbi:MAG: methyltransferase domain-containing protein [Candidatus Binataceae bacterium]